MTPPLPWGVAKFDKWSTGYDGNSETWLEFSYYTFEKVTTDLTPWCSTNCV